MHRFWKDSDICNALQHYSDCKPVSQVSQSSCNPEEWTKERRPMRRWPPKAHRPKKRYAYAVEGDNPTTGLKILGKAWWQRVEVLGNSKSSTEQNFWTLLPPIKDRFELSWLLVSECQHPSRGVRWSRTPDGQWQGCPNIVTCLRVFIRLGWNKTKNVPVKYTITVDQLHVTAKRWVR